MAAPSTKRKLNTDADLDSEREGKIAKQSSDDHLDRSRTITSLETVICKSDNYHHRELPVVHVGKSWTNLSSMASVVIFGDSYSVNFPMGGDGERTWVNYLHGDTGTQKPDIYNFSYAGATVEDDLESQLSLFLSRFPRKKSLGETGALQPDLTCYVLFLGINDCGKTDEDELEPLIEILLDAAHDLYIKAGARNFVFISVPPMDRFPSGLELANVMYKRVDRWNTLLCSAALTFGKDYEGVTVFVFSSHAVYSDVLDDPEEYEFTKEDVTEEGGAIWVDDTHSTSAVHEIMADRLLQNLNSVRRG